MEFSIIIRQVLSIDTFLYNKSHYTGILCVLGQTQSRKAAKGETIKIKNWSSQIS